MTLTTLEKQPGEKPIFAMNFAGKMSPGATILSSPAPVITAVSQAYAGDDSDELVITGITPDGQKVKAYFDGGTHGEIYKVRCTCVDSEGQNLEKDGLLYVFNE